MDFLQLLVKATVRMIRSVRWSRKSWNGYLKLLAWRLRPVMRSLGSL